MTITSADAMKREAAGRALAHVTSGMRLGLGTGVTNSATRVAAATGLALESPVAKMKGADLEGLSFRHPLYERDSLGVTADYVTLEAGTGAVHTAPGASSSQPLDVSQPDRPLTAL